MKKLRISFFFGGCSQEYEVSLMSATAILKNLNQEKYEILMVGITREGDFYLYNGDIDKIENDTWFNLKNCKKVTISTNRSNHGLIVFEDKLKIIPIDLAFPILHGKNGEDGTIQGLLELAKIPYVGCDLSSSLLCMDKYLAHLIVSSKGILTPITYLFSKTTPYENILQTIKDLNYPLFVKPLKAGSSFGITKVKKEEDLKRAIAEAFFYDDKIVIEENIVGFEVGCAIFGNEDLTIGEVDEIYIETDLFDYLEKYNLKTSKIILPARISEEERERIKQEALKIYKILGCKNFARVDMFYTPNKEIIFNEVNTMPGFTAHSRYPNMLKEVGYDFSTILDKLIALGLDS